MSTFGFNVNGYPVRRLGRVSPVCVGCLGGFSASGFRIKSSAKATISRSRSWPNRSFETDPRSAVRSLQTAAIRSDTWFDWRRRVQRRMPAVISYEAINRLVFLCRSFRRPGCGPGHRLPDAPRRRLWRPACLHSRRSHRRSPISFSTFRNRP